MPEEILISPYFRYFFKTLTHNFARPRPKGLTEGNFKIEVPLIIHQRNKLQKHMYVKDSVSKNI
jgi:hypothetical protein